MHRRPRLFGDSRKPMKRKYKVPRGTAANVARQLGLSTVHLCKVVSGERIGSASVRDALERIERAHLESEGK